jgi:hypothetical protein
MVPGPIHGSIGTSCCDELKFPDIKGEIIFVISYNKFKFRGPFGADTRHTCCCDYVGGRYGRWNPCTFDLPSS